jgi:hypothetical protein
MALGSGISNFQPLEIISLHTLGSDVIRSERDSGSTVAKSRFSTLLKTIGQIAPFPITRER